MVSSVSRMVTAGSLPYGPIHPRYVRLAVSSTSHSPLTDGPPRRSRRITAYSSTFDICGMTSTFHQKQLDAALARELVLPKPIDMCRHYCGSGPLRAGQSLAVTSEIGSGQGSGEGLLLLTLCILAQSPVHRPTGRSVRLSSP